jgi:tetratricopeptide (TPR) repeat protein
MLIGALFVRQNKMDEARQSFEKALELSPGYFAAMEQLVNLDIAQQKYEAASARVQAQVDKDPKAAEPWILMARIHIAQAQGYVQAENKNRAAGSPRLRLADVPSAQPEVSKAEAALEKAIELNPNLRTSFLMLADLEVAAGKQQQALERLNVLVARTNDVMALMQVGIIQDSLNNYPAARDAYEKVVAASPNYSPALNNLAYLYSERFNDLDKAYQMADKARQLLPVDPSTADTLGWVLYRRGEYNRAVGLLEESASKLPDEAEVQFHLGMTQYMLGNEGAARLALQKAVQSAKQFEGKDQAAERLALLAIDPKTADAAAIGALQKRLQESPRDPIALDRMGAIQERDGAFDKAAGTYETALKTNPQDAALTVKLAQLYATRLNDPQKALELAKSAHDIAPDDARISALLGRLVYRTGDFKWATSLLEDSARKMPADPQVSFDLAWACYSVGRVSEAQNRMQTAANAGESFAKTDEAKRFLSMVSGANDMASASAAAPEAQKILSSDKNYVPALMILAISQEGQGKADAAAESYNQVLSQFPVFTPASRNLGLLLFARAADDQKAYDLLTKAREAFPQDPDVAKALGVLTYRKGNYARAVQLLKESAQTRKQDAELFYYLGKAQYQLKSKSESKASLQQALEFNLPTKLEEDAKRVLLDLK